MTEQLKDLEAMINKMKTTGELNTPCLLLNVDRLDANVTRLRTHSLALGVQLRPHLKTGKSVDVAKRVLEGGIGPATVSTLSEAELFAKAGVTDILYAVGIAPQKLNRVLAIRERGCDLSILLDSVEQAQAVASKCTRDKQTIPVLIEIDSDGHRGGLKHDDPALIEIALILTQGGAEVRGVLTHAGESYGIEGQEAHAEFAERERIATTSAARTLREAGYECPVVSVGSTPTAHAAKNLDGVTELRAGVYTFFDLVMAGIGVCDIEDIALSVLTTVIGHQKEKDWILVDAGWMALSRDRGTALQAVDQGFGLVCDAEGHIISELVLGSANQEHGVISIRDGSSLQLPDLPIGTQLRILPNHACATAAQHKGYHTISEQADTNGLYWPRISGW